MVSGRDRMFFGLFGVAALATVFAGFSRTYYLNSASAEPLAFAVRMHAVLFSVWMVLFVLQTSLVAARRTDIHRTLGILGLIFAVAVIVSGYLTAIEGARTGWVGPQQPRDASGALSFLAIPIGDLVLFTSMLAAGWYYRRKPETHKRLMVIAMIAVLPPAMFRLPLPVTICLIVLFSLVGPIYDRLVHGHVHMVYKWAVPFMTLSIPLRVIIGGTEVWRVFAGWLIA